MLYDNLNIPKKEGKTYPPIPKDIYQVELLDITSRETPTYDTKNKPDNEKEYEIVLSFQFTLLDGQDNGESLRGRNVWANFVPTYLYIGKRGKNTLFKIVEALIGRELTPEEEAKGLSGKSLNSLISKQCRVAIEPKKSGDKAFDNITDYYKANILFTALTAEEKEKARVKSDEEAQGGNGEITEGDIKIANIPF